MENFTFQPVSDITIGLLAFFFSLEDSLGRFFVFRAPFLSSSRLPPLNQSLLVVPKLRSEFVADVTVGLRYSQKLDVRLCLLCLHALSS